MIFSPNQEVVCVDRECKPTHPGAAKVPNLQYNSIYTIRYYEGYSKNHHWYSVCELPSAFIYSEDSFAPLGEIQEVLECLETERMDF